MKLDREQPQLAEFKKKESIFIPNIVHESLWQNFISKKQFWSFIKFVVVFFHRAEKQFSCRNLKGIKLYCKANQNAHQQPYQPGRLHIRLSHCGHHDTVTQDTVSGNKWQQGLQPKNVSPYLFCAIVEVHVAGCALQIQFTHREMYSFIHTQFTHRENSRIRSSS